MFTVLRKTWFVTNTAVNTVCNVYFKHLHSLCEYFDSNSKCYKILEINMFTFNFMSMRLVENSTSSCIFNTLIPIKTPRRYFYPHLFFKRDLLYIEELIKVYKKGITLTTLVQGPGSYSYFCTRPIENTSRPRLQSANYLGNTSY